MPRKIDAWTAALFWITVLLFAGCQRSATPPRLTKIHLQAINLTYLSFCDVNGKPPSNLDELAPFIMQVPEEHPIWDEEILRALREGKYVVIWNQKGALEVRQGTDVITAYEQDAPERGGFVVFADGQVHWMSAEELERATQRNERPDR
jgi:hypothetical protein